METWRKLNNLNRFDNKFLTVIAEEIRELINKGYYDITEKIERKNASLKDILLAKRENYPIITEIKFSSPSLGEINRNSDNQKEILTKMEINGSSAISVLTQPLYFDGSLENLKIVRQNTELPILMKDIIIDEKQIEAGFNLGANVILLIETLFRDNYNKLEQLIKYARKMGLEILLEVNTKQEFDKSITRDVDILGINNRDLNTLQLDMQTTNRILREEFKINKPIISESGILTSEDIKMIGKSGVNGFLIGTSIMKADNIDKKIRELTSVKK